MAEVFKPNFSAKSGVQRWHGVVADDGRSFRRIGYWSHWIVGKEVFLTAPEAKAVAEVKRIERIASLEKQLAKLRSLNHAA